MTKVSDKEITKQRPILASIDSAQAIIDSRKSLMTMANQLPFPIRKDSGN